MSLILLDGSRPKVELKPLEVRGPVIDCGGKPWRWIGASAFMLPFRVWASDQRVPEILDWYQAAGFNVLRMFWNATIMPPKRLDHLGQPLPAGRVPIDVCKATQDMTNARGLFIEWTAGDFQKNLPDPNAQFRELDAQARIVGLNPLEYCNEPQYNGMTPEDFGPFGGFESSGRYVLANEWEGRKDGEMLQTMPGLRTYFTRHHQRKADWPRLSHDAMEFYDGWNGTVDRGEHKGEPEYFAGVRRPYVDNEPQLCVEADHSSTEWSNPNDGFDFAAGMAMFGAGCTFHSEAGKDALIPGPSVQRCAEQWVQGLNLVPFDTPFGEYTRGGRSNCPLMHRDEPASDGALRTYAMMRGSTAVVIVVRPGQNWQAKPDNGWRITQQLGERGNLMFLER